MGSEHRGNDESMNPHKPHKITSSSVGHSETHSLYEPPGQSDGTGLGVGTGAGTGVGTGDGTGDGLGGASGQRRAQEPTHAWWITSSSVGHSAHRRCMNPQGNHLEVVL